MQAGLDTWLDEGRFDALLRKLDALELRYRLEDGEQASRLRILRVLASAGLGDCGPVQHLLDDDASGLPPQRLAEVASRAAELVVTRFVPDGIPISFGLLELHSPEVVGWNQRVSGSVRVLESAARRFPQDESSIAERIARLHTLLVTNESIRQANARLEELRSLKSPQHRCPRNRGGSVDEPARSAR